MKNRRLTAAIFLMFAFLLTAVTAQDDPLYHNEDADQTHVKEERTTTPLIPSAIFVVNDSGDATDAVPGDGICETVPGNGVCTLRAAVAEANALAGDDIITFDEGISLIQVNGQIAITSNMSIIGNGPDELTIQNIAAQSTTSRIFNITNFVVNLSGMTLTGGNATVVGGAINNTGNLTITDCVITDNTTTNLAGGIRSTNTLTLIDSVVSNNSSTNSTSGGISFAGANITVNNTAVTDNTATGNGGGMNISAAVSATISNSTISNNTTDAASGGFFINRGTITNTTISGNIANGALAAEGGGGVRIQAGANTVSFISCTITDNSAPNAAEGTRSGIWHETGTVNFSNSIVAANITRDIQFDGGTLASSGFNLIGRNTSVETEFPAGMPSGTDYVGTEAAPLDPMLAPLADNGGPTWTHMPSEGSPAIDKGDSFDLDTDQRGFIRTIDLAEVPNTPTGDGTDIGAVESQSTPPAVEVSVSGRVMDNLGRGIPSAMVIITSENTQKAVTSTFGYFRFDNVEAGQTYTITVRHRGFEFDPIVLTVNESIDGLVITPLP